ncbi:MAG TPA: ferritin-like domain-containing protein, partial [Chthonomonadaceae bacterium]|nr:ferritin-like domain-containing protein [Chthonomonadaceae bacterium]
MQSKTQPEQAQPSIPEGEIGGRPSRRSFLRHSVIAGAATMLPLAGLVTGAKSASASSGSDITPGDVAILRFLAAAEIIESDLWLQYAELGGTQDNELPGLTGGNPIYTRALKKLDGDMPQYIHDNTEDEFSHWFFINAFLMSKGLEPVNLDAFRTLPSSTAPGAQPIGRLTNLMQLTVDTSWWTRYRSRTVNPDLDPDFVFPQAVPSLSNGQFPAIPRDKSDLMSHDHIQAIANTAGFHFAFIEQGGSSLYHGLAQKVTSAEVLQILLGIGPVETSHFQTWHDKA